MTGPGGSVVARRRTRPRCRRRRCRGRTAGTTTSAPLMAAITSVPACGPRGTTCMPSSRRNSTKKSNSSGGSTASTTAVTCTSEHLGEPERGPLPPAEVGQGQDRADARGQRPLDVVVALDREPGVDLRRRQLGQPERVDPVAGVGAEGLVHGPAQGRPGEARAVRPAGGCARSAAAARPTPRRRWSWPGHHRARPPVGAPRARRPSRRGRRRRRRLDVERTESHAAGLRECDGCPAGAARPARSDGRCGWPGRPADGPGAWARPAAARRWPGATPSRIAARR